MDEKKETSFTETMRLKAIRDIDEGMKIITGILDRMLEAHEKIDRIQAKRKEKGLDDEG
jgi:hypothetical protein